MCSSVLISKTISTATESSSVVITMNATPTHWAFSFKESGLPLSISGSWSGSICKTHIALQELKAAALMLCRMAFWLSGKLVALHLDNSTT